MISLLLAPNFTRFDSSFMNANAHEARSGKRALVAHARLFILGQHGQLMSSRRSFYFEPSTTPRSAHRLHMFTGCHSNCKDEFTCSLEKEILRNCSILSLKLLAAVRLN